MKRWEQVAIWLDEKDPKLGVEVGVKKGQFTEHLLRVFPTLEMYSVDPWDDQPCGAETYEEWNWQAIRETFYQVTRKVGNRCKLLNIYSDEAALALQSYQFDFVFIDAQHDYKSVSADIKAWELLVKPGGLLCGHDYNKIKFPGVVQAVDESGPSSLGADDTWCRVC